MTKYNPDLELNTLIELELKRQSQGITLIASENYAYKEVLDLMGSALTNKYAEGYPGKRYYAGCTFVDQIEQLAIDRCKSLFKADHANVQPHSGSAANMAVLLALLKPGDTIMGMSLKSGGHLTHGHPVSFSGALFQSVSYAVNPITELLDYEAIEQLAQQHRPKLIIAGGSSYSRDINFERFSQIASSVDAYLLADCAHTAGLIATGLYPHPFPYADIITGTTHKTLRGPRGGFIACKKEYAERIDRAVFPLTQGGPFMHAIAAKAFTFKRASEQIFISYQQQAVANAQAMIRVAHELGYRVISGGSDMHLFVIDLTSKQLSGLTAEKALERESLYVSRSTIPYDTRSPFNPSGIRLGTLAITSQGYDALQSEAIMCRLDEILIAAKLE